MELILHFLSRQLLRDFTKFVARTGNLCYLLSTNRQTSSDKELAATTEWIQISLYIKGCTAEISINMNGSRIRITNSRYLRQRTRIIIYIQITRQFERRHDVHTCFYLKEVSNRSSHTNTNTLGTCTHVKTYMVKDTALVIALSHYTSYTSKQNYCHHH